MREILFRGKRLDNGRWLVGSLIQHDITMICGDDEQRMVDPETVGQYTGMTDRTGTRIFEGDIVQVGDERVLIVWQGTRFVPLKKNKRPMTWFLVSTTGKIIGNEFDDPELLRGERNGTA